MVALTASRSNTSEIVLKIFRRAVKKYGRPSRVRGDRGTENLLVAYDMNCSRGANRGSFLWGTSTHNTRIERLWGEVGRQFMRQWRAFLLRLEDSYGLKRSIPAHLWLLCELFIPMIDNECKQFMRRWNRHSIENSSISHMSPNVSHINLIQGNYLLGVLKDLYTLGQVQHGVYKAAPRDAHLAFSDISSECSSVMDLEKDGFSVSELDNLDGEDWQGIGNERFTDHDGEGQENEFTGVLGNEVSTRLYAPCAHDLIYDASARYRTTTTMLRTTLRSWI